MAGQHGYTSGFGWPLGIVFSVALILLPSTGQHCNMSNMTTFLPVLAENTEWYHSSVNKTNVLHIGTALTLDRSTRYGNFGQHLQQGYTMYFDWLNKNFGGLTVDGEKYWVKLHLLDDKSDGDTVENITRHLVHDKKIKHFLGPYGSTLTARATKVLDEESDAVMVCGSAASTSVFQNRSRMFGILSTSVSFLEEVFNALQFRGVDTVAYMYEDLAFTRGVCSVIPSTAADKNMRVVFGANGFGGFTEDGTGRAAREMVVNMSRTRPDALIGCVYANACNHILSEAAKIRFNPKAIVLTVCVTTENFRTDNGDNAGYVLGVAPWTREVVSASQLTGMKNQDFVLQYEQQFGGRVPYQAAAAFSSAATLAHAITLANTVNDPGKVADELRNMQTLSTFGEIAFDSNGQGKNPIKVVQVVGNMTPVVAPPSFSTRGLFYPKPTFNAMTCKNNDPFNVGRHGLFPNGSCLPCSMTEVAPYNATLTFRQCKKLICPPGHRSRIYPASNFTQGGALCMECTPGYFASASGSTQCDACSAGRYQNQRAGTACTACSVGKYTRSRASHACANCNGGRFSSTKGASSCLSCPVGSYCVENAQGFIANYSNNDGWYTWNENIPGLPVLIRCQHGKDGSACVRNGQCHVDPETNEVAMEGPFCGKCRQGYGRKRVNDVCTKCPSVFVSILLISFQGFLVITLSMVIYMLVLWTDLTKPKNITSVIIKQVFNYFCMSTVIFEVTDFEIKIPYISGIVSYCMDVLRLLFGTASPLFVAHAADCFMSNFSAPYKMYIALSLVCVPMWVMLLKCLFWIVWFYYKSRGLKPPRRSRLITLFIVNLFILHPRVTELCLSVFRCKHFDKPRLMSDTSVDCQESSHGVWQVLGALSFILYSLGIPFAIYLVLRYYKRHGKLPKRKTVNTLGFLYCGFEPQCYYFEAIFMLRKVLLQLIILIPPLAGLLDQDDKTIKCVAMLIVSCFFLAVHMAAEPYDNRGYFALDRIEGAMLWAILLTLLTQSWLFISDAAHAFNADENGDHAETKRNTDIRDTVGIIFVFLCHARFFWLVVRLALRPIFADITRWAMFDHGFVEVRREGLTVFKADDRGRKLFTTMFQELADLLMETRGSVSYEELVTCLQFMTVNCLYHRKKERYQNGLPFDDETDEQMHDSVWESLEREKLSMIFRRAKHHFMTLFMTVKHAGDAAAARAALMGGFTSAHLTVSRFTEEEADESRDVRTFGEPVGDSAMMANINSMREIDRLKHFNPNTLARCEGVCFSIEELHMSMVRLSKDIGSISLGKSGTGIDHRPSRMSSRPSRTSRKTGRSSEPGEESASPNMAASAGVDDMVSKGIANLVGSEDEDDEEGEGSLSEIEIDEDEEVRELEAELKEVQEQLHKIQDLHQKALRRHELDVKENHKKRENLVADMKDALAKKAKRDHVRLRDTSDWTPRSADASEHVRSTDASEHEMNGEELAADRFEMEDHVPELPEHGQQPNRISKDVLSALSAISNITASGNVCRTCHNRFQDDSNFCRICGQKRAGQTVAKSDGSSSEEDDDEELTELRKSLHNANLYYDKLEENAYRMKLDIEEMISISRGQDEKLDDARHDTHKIETLLEIEVDVSGSYMDTSDHVFDVVQEGSHVEFEYQGVAKTGSLHARILNVHDDSWSKGYVFWDGDIVFDDGGQWTKQLKFDQLRG